MQFYMKKLIKSILAILLFSAFTLNLYADEKVNDEALKKVNGELV